MKKRIKKASIIIIIVSILLLLKGEFAVSEFILGDVNDDFLVDSKDMMLISRHISAVNNDSNSEWILTDEKLEAADINRNGEVNNGDVMAMIRYLTTKDNPYNIGTKYQVEEKSLLKKENSIDKVPVNLEESKESKTISTLEIKDNIMGQSIGKNTVEVNVMKEVLPSSDKIKFEKEEIKIKTHEAEKIKVITDNSEEPIKITTSDSNVVEIYGVGIAVGKNEGEAIITAEQGNEKAQCRIIVEDRNEDVYKIELDKKDIELEKEKSTKIEAKTEPANKEVQWTSGNNEILEVTKDGIITGKKAGTTVVIATSGTQRAISTVTIKDKENEVQEVKIDKKELTITQGQTDTITVEISPKNTTTKEVMLSQENDNILLEKQKIEVNEEGFAEVIIQANKVGKTTIIAKAGDKETKITVTVIEPKTEKVTLDTSEINMELNQLRRITATIEPETLSNKTVKWTSSNTSVVSVDQNGLVTSKNTGEAIITASVDDKSATCKVKVEKTTVSVRDITMSNSNLSVKEDAETKLIIELTPANSSNKVINVKLNNGNASIENEKVTVNNKGKAEIKVKGKKVGKSVLTVSSGAIVKKCNISITPKVIPVSKITASTKNLKLDKGKKQKITITIEPKNATNKQITVKKNNSNIELDKTKVTAGSDGKASITITGKKAGESIVTVTSGGKSESIKVKINAVVESIKLNKTKLGIEVGSSQKISATVSPANAVNKEIKWKSSNTKVVEVDQNGKITAKSDGTATITATAGGKKATCKVTVAKTKVILDRKVLMIDNIHYNFADMEAKLSSNSVYKPDDITWTIDSTSIAKFRKDGQQHKKIKNSANAQIVGLRYGDTIIRATLPNGSQAECKLKVITSSSQKYEGDRDFTWRGGQKFYLRSGNWGNKYVEAYVNNAAKIVKKYKDSTFKDEAAKKTIWCYQQKSLNINADHNKKKILSVTGRTHAQSMSVHPYSDAKWDFMEKHQVKKKGELSPNDYIFLFTSKNQWEYLLRKDEKTGEWKVISAKISSAGYERDTFENYLNIMFLHSYMKLAYTYAINVREASTWQNLVHYDTAPNTHGQPSSGGCIHLGTYNDEIYYRLFVEAGVGTRFILF